MSEIITLIKFPFKRRDNPTVMCALSPLIGTDSTHETVRYD